MNKVILWTAQLSDLGKTIDHKNQQLRRWVNRYHKTYECDAGPNTFNTLVHIIIMPINYDF